MIELLVGALWRLGGAGCPPFYRYWRRLGWPIVAGLVALFAQVPWWMCLLVMGATFGTTTLPVTFFGSKIPDHWFNWIWLWILGYLYGLPSIMIHGWNGFLYALVPSVVMGLFVTLSNIQTWPAKTFVNEACEVLIGVATAMAICGLS